MYFINQEWTFNEIQDKFTEADRAERADQSLESAASLEVDSDSLSKDVIATINSVKKQTIAYLINLPCCTKKPDLESLSSRKSPEQTLPECYILT